MLKRLMLVTVALLLSLGAFAAPAATADTSDVAILNGIPTKVDICIGSREIFSNVRFGRAAFWTGAEAGTYRFVIRKAAAGTCRGRKLGVTRTTWLAGEDHTSVIWRPWTKIRLKTFTNDRSVPGGKASVVFRHAARFRGSVDAWLWEHVQPTDDEWPPTFNNVARGQSSGAIAIRPGQFRADVLAARPTARFAWAGFWHKIGVDQYQQLYLIGTSKRNYRMAGIYGPGDVIP